MLHRPVEGDRSPRVLRGEESRLGLRARKSQRLRVCEDVKGAQCRGNGPKVRQAQAPRDRHRSFQRKIGQQVSEEQVERQGSAERPPKESVSPRDPPGGRIRMPSRLRQEDLQKSEPPKIVDRPAGIRGEGADQFDREAVRRCRREETRSEVADRGRRGRVENETAPFVLQPDRANDPERIFPEPIRRYPHATDPFPARVVDPAEGIEQAPVLDEAAGSEPEEESVDGEVPPRRVIDRLPIVVTRCGYGPRWARAPTGARVGDVDVLLPPIDRDPVHREMPARRHDLSNARHLDGKRPENVPGPPVRKPRDQQVDVPRLPPLDDVPKETPDEIYRPSGTLDRPDEVPEKPAQGRAAEQRAAQCLRRPWMAWCRDGQGCPGFRCPGPHPIGRD